MPAALAPRRRAPALSAPAGAFPVSVRVAGVDAARLDRLAVRYGGRSAALLAGLRALDTDPDPAGVQPVR